MEKKKTGISGWMAALGGKNMAQPADTVPDPEVRTEAETTELGETLPSQETEESQIEPVTDRLKLSSQGPVWTLWREWNEKEEDTNPPSLSLENSPDDTVQFEAEELEKEKQHAAELLERFAAERLKKLSVPVAEGQDPIRLKAQCWVVVAQSGLAAWIFAVPPTGGEPPLTEEEIAEALRKAKVTTGLHAEQYQTLLQERPYFRLCMVAWGVPALPGKDGGVTDHYPRENTRQVALDEEGNVDYRAQSYVQTIKKGDVICDVHAPVEGTPGVMVTGQVIKPPPVKPAVLPRGSNTALDEEGLHLVATMSGHLLYHTNAFQVKSILQVPGNVDYSTGNINFLGDVHIAGDVREKFTVRATGTVTIDGLVEAATVEADGDIIVTKGVLGDNKALLKSKKSVKAKYLENCVVYSGDCTFADCIINSEIYSDQRISVLTGRGTILGGSLTAAGQIEANIIGSQSGRKTEIVLGVLPYVQKEQDDNRVALEALRKELEEVNRQLNFLDNQGSKEEENKKHADLRLRKSVLALKEAKLVKRQQELMEMKVDRARCRLEAGTIYPTTILQIGAAVRKIEEVWKGCTAVYDSQTKDIEIF